MHWACSKVRAEIDSTSSNISSGKSLIVQDQEICKSIRERFSDCPGITYAEVAAEADQIGRRRLATMLLESEPRAANQVPQLLSMQAEHIALEKALRSGDADLIYYALLHIQRNLDDDAFHRLVAKFLQACDLLIIFSHSTSHDCSRSCTFDLGDSKMRGSFWLKLPTVSSRAAKKLRS